MATALLSLDPSPAGPRLSRSIWFQGGLMTVHADSADTGGQFALVEVSGSPGGEPPKHIHSHEDELFYVMEGKLKAFRGDEQIILTPGESAFLPRGVPHTFKILSSYARWLVYITPAGFEEFFRVLGRPAEKLAPEDVPTRIPAAELVSAGSEFKITFVP